MQLHFRFFASLPDTVFMPCGNAGFYLSVLSVYVQHAPFLRSHDVIVHVALSGAGRPVPEVLANTAFQVVVAETADGAAAHALCAKTLLSVQAVNFFRHICV